MDFQPQVNSVLQPFIQIYTGIENPDGTVSTSTEFAAAQSIDIDIKRDAGYWRQFKGKKSHEITETYPALPEYSFKLKRIALYGDNGLKTFFQAMGFGGPKVSTGNAPTTAVDMGASGLDIVNQNSGIVVKVSLYKPGVVAPVLTFSLTGCWAKNNNMKFDVNTKDMPMVQEIDFIARGLVVA